MGQRGHGHQAMQLVFVHIDAAGGNFGGQQLFKAQAFGHRHLFANVANAFFDHLGLAGQLVFVPAEQAQQRPRGQIPS